MKKFTDKINESNEFDPNELEMGIKIESEHNDIYDYLLNNVRSLPLSARDFYERIAKAHLREIPDYYSRLKIIEKEE
jgi:hypothetical protein